MAGLTPVDDDEKMVALLEMMVENDTDNLYGMLAELRETVAQTEHSEEPEIFAYAKMMNYFRSTEKPKAELVHILAAALWMLHGQSNAKIYVLRSDSEVLQTETDNDGRTQV